MTKQALVENEPDEVLRTEPIIWPGDSGYNALVVIQQQAT